MEGRTRGHLVLIRRYVWWLHLHREAILHLLKWNARLRQDVLNMLQFSGRDFFLGIDFLTFLKGSVAWKRLKTNRHGVSESNVRTSISIQPFQSTQTYWDPITGKSYSDTRTMMGSPRDAPSFLEFVFEPGTQPSHDSACGSLIRWGSELQ